MGDPGVAKSQLLSYIDRLAPRSNEHFDLLVLTLLHVLNYQKLILIF